MSRNGPRRAHHGPGLDNWLTKNPEAPYYDRLVAQSLADELRGVLPR